MRNLKKILALVLALTMVLGLSISAGAGTFTDVNEDDDYAAAIELLASLDVLAGMGDGTYN
ncbi:MAG: S-layer homology domain-containing protein, partial [Clostridia bacterium]|nr:S-layer homology domain-containing protein [Clostridia bacterium]